VDRDAIERRDFPVGRRGYDPAAVDAHLRAVADQIEALRERADAPPAGAQRPSLSAGASEQVRQILEAAERSAADLRDRAGREAGDHVARVQEAAGAMRDRLDGLQHELDNLLESLKRSGEMLEHGLARLRENVSEVGGAEPDPEPAPEPQAAAMIGDEAGARLTALNMALSGTPREQTAAYLAEHYELADPEALLEDVYNRADA
jgi:DivIVA domain-containing protein